MKKVIWFLLGGAALGGLVYYFLFVNKSEREQILEKARHAKKEKAEAENTPPAVDGTI